jgi:hypothetical protein
VIAGRPVIAVSDSAGFQAAFDRIAKGELITVDVAPKTVLRFPRINDSRGTTVRNLWSDPMRRPLITSLKATKPEDLPVIKDHGGGFAGYMAGLCHVDIDGFKFEGNVWGFIMGQAGGSGISDWGREGIIGLGLRRVWFHSANEAAMILSGEKVREIVIEDFMATGGREGLYIGFGGNGTKNPALEPDIADVKIRRGEIKNWGTKQGAEAIDWKHGSDMLIEDIYAHHGRCFSQGVIMAPGPNNIGTWRTKPSGTIRRVAIGHISLMEGRGNLDASGVYLSMPDINVEDLTVFDIPGAAVLRGKNALGDTGTSTVTRVRAAACKGGVYVADGWGWEGAYPNVPMSNVDLSIPPGAPESWTLASFATSAPPSPPPPPPPPPVKPPVDTELEDRVLVLEGLVQAHTAQISELQAIVDQLADRIAVAGRILNGEDI